MVGDRHWRFFTVHEAAVVEAACSRLVPGSDDHVGEAGHPGAREAQVTVYIDNLLGCFSVSPPTIYADHRRISTGDGKFVEPTAPQIIGWKERIQQLQGIYRAGIRQLDACSRGGSYLVGNVAERDAILLLPEVRDFRNVLFDHAIEGMYADPVYGGNYEMLVWDDLGFAKPDSYEGYKSEDVSSAEDPPSFRDRALEDLVSNHFALVVQLLVGSDSDHG